MQHALRAACQIAHYEPKEVNPKQTTLSPSQLGNYVRLPYPFSRNGYRDRQVMIDRGGNALGLVLFVEEAIANRTDTATLEAAAALYVQPPPPKPVQWDKPHYEGDATTKLSPLAFVIYRDGPLPGQDRSLTLYRLAAKAFESGLAAGDVLNILRNADSRWGKMSTRPDGEKQLLKIIERASS